MLIKPPSENDTMSSVEIIIGIDTAKDIADYLKKSGVETYDYFIEKACQMILEKDVDWVKYKRNKK